MRFTNFLFFKTETIILLISLVLLLLLLNSCSPSGNKIEIDSLINNWQVDYIELNGDKVKHLNPNDDEFEYDFKSDRTYIIYLQDKKDKGSTTGEWELNTEDNSIHVKNEKNEIYGKIISVTSNKMVMIPVAKTEGQSESLVKYHYISK